jgi:hypothetical protein
MKKVMKLLLILVLMLALPQASISNLMAATNDPVVHLAFDNNTTDSSGRNNNGTAVGASPYVTGQIGNAVSFTGVAGQYVYVCG